MRAVYKRRMCDIRHPLMLNERDLKRTALILEFFQKKIHQKLDQVRINVSFSAFQFSFSAFQLALLNNYSKLSMSSIASNSNANKNNYFRSTKSLSTISRLSTVQLCATLKFRNLFAFRVWSSTRLTANCRQYAKTFNRNANEWCLAALCTRIHTHSPACHKEHG